MQTLKDWSDRDQRQLAPHDAGMEIFYVFNVSFVLFFPTMGSTNNMVRESSILPVIVSKQSLMFVD